MGLHESSELLSGLAPFELEFFQQNGFVFRERFTTDDEVAALREIYDHLFAVRAGWDEGQQFDLGGNGPMAGSTSRSFSVRRAMPPSCGRPPISPTLARSPLKSWGRTFKKATGST